MNRILIFVLIFFSIVLAGVFFFRYCCPQDQNSPKEVLEVGSERNLRKSNSEVVSRPLEISDRPRSAFGADPVKLEPSSFALLLPELEKSDQMIRQAALSLGNFSEAEIEAFLPAEQLIRKFVAILDNAASGKFSSNLVADLKMNGSFVAREIEEGIFEIDFRSYQRFDNIADVIYSIDANRAAQLYLTIKPLISEAYKELGYLADDFDAVILSALEGVLATPEVPRRVLLKRPVVMYEYLDPEYEALNGFQKLILRTGPRNSRLLKQKAREIKSVMRQVESR